MKGNSLWCDTTVAHILRNEMYTGTLIQGKKKMLSYKVHKLVDVPKEDWIIVENSHEPIIDKETFNKVQDIINRDTRIKNDGTGEVSLFAGYIRCADCKRAMNKNLQIINGKHIIIMYATHIGKNQHKFVQSIQ